MREIRHSALRIVRGTLADAGLAALCFHFQLNLATVSLIFLLSVVFQALSASFLPAVILSFIAAAFLDYFFIPPVLTWRVASPFDLIALVAFITTAVVITRLASRARAEARKSERRGRNLEQLFHCSERLSSLDPERPVIGGMLKIFCDLFGMTAACFFDAEDAQIHVVGNADSLAEMTREAYLTGADTDDARAGFSVRCIRTSGRLSGAIGFRGLRDSELVAGSLVALTIANLDRARSFQSASRAAAEAKAEVFRAAVLDALAHEFKTPLAIILAAAGALRDIAPLTADQCDLTEEIEQEVSRLNTLSTRLLRDTAQESARAGKRSERIDLHSVISSLAARFPDRRIAIHARPAAVCDVLADEELVRLAVGQLIENAVKYSPPGSEIAVSIESDNDSVAVRVRNGGSSVLLTDRNRIFDRFYRSASAQHLAPGSGLGLYVSRKIAVAQGGTLALESDGRNGDGVVFRMTLPRFERHSQNGTIENKSLSCR